MTLTVRSATVSGATTKGSELTHAELDENFNHLRQSSNHTFTPSGSGASNSTVQAKLRERVSPEDFGAVGDGTTDDTAAVNKALAAAKIVEGSPGKTYLVTGLTVSGDGVTFRGSSLYGSRLRFTDTDGTMLTVTGSLFNLENWEIETPSATHTEGEILDVQGTNGRIHNVRITGNFWDCFKFETDGKGGWRISDIRIVGGNTLNSFIRVKGTSSSVAEIHVTNVISATNTTWTEAAVIFDTFTDTVTWSGGTLGGIGKLVHIKDSGNSTDPRYIRFNGVGLENSTSSDDLVTIAAGDDLRFSNGYCALGKNAFVVTAGRDIKIHNNHIVSIQRCALDLDGGSRVAFENNTVLDTSQATDVTYSSVDIAANVSEWRVRGNTFRLRAGTTNKPLRQLTIASGTSTKFSYGDNDWGVAGTDYGAAGAAAVSDGGTGTNVVIEDNVQTLLYRGGAAISHTGTTDATALVSVTLPAGSLRTRDGVRIHAAGTTAGTNAAKDVSLTFGGQTVSAIQIPQANTDTWELIATVYNANAVSGANAQMFIGHATRSAADTEGGEHRLKSAGLSIDTTADVTITVTGDLANTGDTIVLRVCEIEVLRR